MSCQLHSETPIPDLHMVNLPQLITPAKPSTLTRLLASSSPKTSAFATILATPPSPTSPAKLSSRSPFKSPVKRGSSSRDFAKPFPFPLASKSTATESSKSSIAFPQTPSSRHSKAIGVASLLTPSTPSASPFRRNVEFPLPSTPVHQRGANAATAPQTPSSSRRQALYDRIRQKSLTNSPMKSAIGELPSTKMSKDQLFKLSQEEMRRRVLLGRLGGVAESVWMYAASSSVFKSLPVLMFLTGCSPGRRDQSARHLSENAVLFLPQKWLLQYSNHLPYHSRLLKPTSPSICSLHCVRFSSNP